MAITRGSFPLMHQAQVKTWFDDLQSESEHIWRKLYKVTPTDAPFEQITNHSGFGPMVEKEELGGITFDSALQGFSTHFTVLNLALGYAISTYALDDDKSNRLHRILTEALSRSCAETPELLAFQIINEAFSNTRLYGDQKPLCSLTHPAVGAGGGVSQNRPTIDCSFSEAAAEDAYINIARWVNGKGIQKNLRPQMLLVATENDANAYRYLNSIGRPGTANNDPNFTKDTNKFPKGYEATPYIEDAGQWQIITNALNGLTCFERQALKFGEDIQMTSLVHRYIAHRRMVFGCSSWEAMYGSPGL